MQLVRVMQQMTAINFITLGSPCEPEADDGADDSKHFNRKKCVDFACVGVRANYFQQFASRDDYFLHLGSTEVSLHCMGDPRRPL